MKFHRLQDAGDLSGKTALMRVDFNTPMADGKVSDDTRLRAALASVAALSRQGAKTVLLSHLGRPKGKIRPDMSLKPVASAFAALLGRPVTFAENCGIGPKCAALIASRPDGDVILLENMRFLPGEETNDPDTAKALAKLGDIYVNDAFSAAHRAHASTEGIAHLLPAYAGLALQKELDALERALGSPKRPVMAVVGGAKVSSKITLLKNLVTKVGHLVIGGGMANTFLAAQGHPIGKSLCEHDLLALAREIEAAAKAADCAVILPQDLVVAAEFKAHAAHRICGLDEVGAEEMILDAGPKTVAAISQVMGEVQTLIWNGPLGAFELAPFDAATVAAAQAAGRACQSGALIAVAGGGDTVAALNHAGVGDQFSFVSTAGGAFLEWMEGKALPGIEALRGSTG